MNNLMNLIRTEAQTAIFFFAADASKLYLTSITISIILKTVTINPATFCTKCHYKKCTMFQVNLMDFAGG